MIHARNASLVTYDKDKQESLPVKLLVHTDSPVQQGEYIMEREETKSDTCIKSEIYIRPKVYICKNCGYMSTKIDKKYLNLFK
jgi:hypothetical protein